MIQANELRVGNWLINPFGGKGTVESIYLDSVKLKESNSFVPLVHCKPIQLTDEILLKCGFKKGDEYYFLNGYWASFDADFPLCFGNEGCCQREIIKQNIQHLHQLQNLYFALTGQELQITL
jgi:hypothetical protein